MPLITGTAHPGESRAGAERRGQVAHGRVQQLAQVAAVALEPLLVRGDGHAQHRVGDRLRQQPAGGLAGTLGHEIRDHLPPLRVAQGGVGLQHRHAQDQPHPAPVPALVLRGHLVEVDDGQPDGVHQRPLRRAGGQPAPHPVQFVLEVPPRDVVLGREVAEEGPAADAGRDGDVVDRGALEPLPVEQLERDVLQLGPGGDTPAAKLGRYPRSAHRPAPPFRPAWLGA